MFWRRLEDVLKTSWRCLEDVLKTSWGRLEDVLKTYSQDEYIGLDQDVFWRRRRKTSSSRWMFGGTVFTEHFWTTASTISETCFEFQIGEGSAIRSINKADARFERKRELVWKFYYNYSWLFSAKSIAPVDFHRKNNHVLLSWFSFRMCLIHFNQTFHLGRKQFFHSICLKWIEAPYPTWRKQPL